MSLNMGWRESMKVNPHKHASSYIVAIDSFDKADLEDWFLHYHLTALFREGGWKAELRDLRHFIILQKRTGEGVDAALRFIMSVDHPPSYEHRRDFIREYLVSLGPEDLRRFSFGQVSEFLINEFLTLDDRPAFGMLYAQLEQKLPPPGEGKDEFEWARRDIVETRKRLLGK